MKNILLTSLFLLLSVNLIAQFDNNKILRFNVGYAEVGTSNGVSSIGAVSTDVSEGEIGLTFGFLVNKQWELGLGINYEYQHSNAISEVEATGLWRGIQITDTKVHKVMGRIYTAYNVKLFNKLYFNPVISLNIGHAMGNVSVKTMTSGLNSPDPTSYTEYFSLWIFPDTKISYDYCAFRAAPALTYFFNNKIAATMNFGNFQLSMIDWEWDSHQWIASFRPAYWQLGFIIAF